jgi:hypothetical protein
MTHQELWLREKFVTQLAFVEPYLMQLETFPMSNRFAF